MRIFITGTAGFIGFHLARLLLQEGHSVHGFDGLTNYYDVSLKRRRHALLREHPAFTATEALLEDADALQQARGRGALRALVPRVLPLMKASSVKTAPATPPAANQHRGAWAPVQIGTCVLSARSDKGLL